MRGEQDVLVTQLSFSFQQILSWNTNHDTKTTLNRNNCVLMSNRIGGRGHDASRILGRVWFCCQHSCFRAVRRNASTDAKICVEALVSSTNFITICEEFEVDIFNGCSHTYFCGIYNFAVIIVEFKIIAESLKKLKEKWLSTHVVNIFTHSLLAIARQQVAAPCRV